jgi:hypothetical protein
VFAPRSFSVGGRLQNALKTANFNTGITFAPLSFAFYPNFAMMEDEPWMH